MNLFKTSIKIVYLAIIISIISFSFAFYSVFSSDTRFFSVIEQHKRLSINSQIHSTYPNLASVIVHFERPATDSGSFVFQLQEVGKSKVNYKARYEMRDIYYLPAYPFGFPILPDSEKKIYTLKISSPLPLFVSRDHMGYEIIYSFDKRSILRGENSVQFIKGKLYQYGMKLLDSQNFIFFLFPTALYILLSLIHLILKDRFENTMFYQQIKELIRPTFIALFISIGYDILIVPKPNDLSITILCSIWMLLIYVHRYTSQKSFTVAFFFLFLCPILIISNMPLAAEKVAIWAYMYMVMGTVHVLIETKKKMLPHTNNVEEKIYYILSYIKAFDDLILFLYKKITTPKQKPIPIKISLKDHVFFAIKKIGDYSLFALYIIIATTIVLSIITLYTKIMSARDRKLKNPTIQTMEPKLVYPATKVIVLGNSFGSKIDERYRLMKDSEEIRIDYWEDHKIIFTVPLSWKQPGMMNIWVERPIQWNGETIIEKTIPLQIKLLKVTGQFTMDDDLYFEQMKTWKKETKEINGYK